MKVTVCFKNIKVVVPCGDGHGLIKDLLEDAITRYKKVQLKNQDHSWLTVNNVKLLLSDGGILDPDDRIIDVIDDKEQIQAIFDGDHHSLEEHSDNNGDGMSGSSLGTSSPDLFHDNIAEQICNGKEPNDVHVDDQHNIIITKNDFLADSGLRVRRESEPSLFSADDAKIEQKPPSSEFPVYSQICKVPKSRKDPVGSISTSSEIKNGPLVVVESVTIRQEVVTNDLRTSSEADDHTNKQENELVIVLPKSSEPLGIHVVPSFDEAVRNIGLSIERIETGGRIDRDGRLYVHDKIIEINFQNLYGLDFSKAQDIFRSALLAPELRIKLLRPVGDPPGTASGYSEPAAETSVSTTDGMQPNGSKMRKKIPPAVPARNPKTQLSSKTSNRLTMQTIFIELNKGVQGLGFSVTTHNGIESGPSPIYVKAIFPEGAAIEDGRLKPGDVLLEINNVSLANKTKAEAVRMLRNSPTGSSILLLVNRPVSIDEIPVIQQRETQNRTTAQRPLSTLGFFPNSTSHDDEELDEDNEDEEQDDSLDIVFNSRRVGNASSMHAGFGSMSNIDEAGIERGSFEQNDIQTGGKSTVSNNLGPASSLLKSRKSISMDDLRRTFVQRTTEVSFDDDVDYPVASLNKMRDFNQSFRAAVIDKSYNVPASNAPHSSANSGIPVQKIEKLKVFEKNKDKKEHHQRSGKKFGWLFRFGKSKKSDLERERTDQPSGNVDGVANNGKPVALSKTPTEESLHEHQSSQLEQSSQPPKFELSNEQGRQTDRGFLQLHKEDYMIMTQQANPSSRDANGYYNRRPEPSGSRSFDEQCSRQYGQPQTHPVTNRNGFDSSHEQFYGHNVPQSQNGYSVTATRPSYAGHAYRQDALKKSDVHPGYHRHEKAPSHDAYQQRFYPSENIDPVTMGRPQGYYQQGRPQFPESISLESTNRMYYQSRDVQVPILPSRDHYYQRDNWHEAAGLPNQHYYHRDPAWDNCPLDLSRYELKPWDNKGDGSTYGYRNQELIEEDTRRRRPASAVQGGSRIQDQPYSQTRAVVQQLQHSNLYQAKFRQNNMPSASDRW